MDLFKLLGTIAIENAEAKKALEDVSNEGQKTESKLSKAFGAIGRGAAAAGKAIATGLAVGATAMAGLTVKALQLSGDLEQNMGGAEQVFKDLGGSIKEMSTTIITGYDEATGKAITATTNLETVSKEAYKNMGLSQSEYLATANKMGALFQGAGFDTQQALDLSSQAMQRAADVASIMGIDTESAMEAVAGAAKGNFTMMDNLGVAMNDTAIAAYAQSKGINKATNEMSQQEKIGLAMEMFLEKTSYAAGNYAKENETLAGSLGTAKAAFTNFLAGSGDVSSLVSSFSNLANVVVKNLTEIAPRLTQGITDLVQQVVPLIPPLLNQLLPVLVQGAVSLVNGLVAAMPSIVQAIMESLPALIDGLLNLITQLAMALPQIIQPIIQALPSMIQSIVNALPTLIPALIDGIIQCIVMICQNFSSIIQPLIDALPTIIITIVQAIVENLPALIQGIIQLVMGIVQAIPQIIQALVDALPTVISLLVQALLENLPAIIMGLIQVVIGIVASLPQIFGSLIQAVPAALGGIWDGIKNVFGGVGEWFGNVFKGAWDAVVNVFKGAGKWFSGIWNNIKNAFSAVGNWFKNAFKGAWDGITNIFKGAGKWFGGIWDNIKSAFSAVGTWFKDIFQQAWNSITGIFGKIGSFFSGLWDDIKNAFTAIGTKIGNAIGDAVKKGINGVIGMIEGIINGFFGLINGAINLINKIPGVKISKIKEVKFQRLAKGGVVDGETPAVVGEAGAEAVIPLEKNTKGIELIAQKLFEKMPISMKVANVARSVSEKLSGILGISSHSGVFRDKVGKPLADGVAVGIAANSDKAKNASEEMAKKVLDAAQKRLDKQKVYNEMTLSEEAAFWDEVRQEVKEGTDARVQADKKYFDAKKSLNEQIVKAEEELQGKLDGIAKRIDERAQEHLDSFGGLFEMFEADSSTSNKSMMKGLESQVKAFEVYGDSLDKLKSRIGGTGLFEELEAQGMDAIEEIYILSKVSDEELKKFLSLYEKRKSLAQGIANKELEDDFASETQKAFEEFATTCGKLGHDVSGSIETMRINATNSFESFTNAITSGLYSVTSALTLFKESIQLDKLSIENPIENPIVSFRKKLSNYRSKMQLPTPDGSNGVEWYASAMKDPVLMTEPTIFGYNSATGKFMGGGEAGSEVVSGTNTLMNMIQTAVTEQNGKMVAYLHKIIEMLAAYFPQMLEAFDVDLYINGKVLAAELAPDMNDALGLISSRKERGR